jgi:hypothetical protein
MDNVQSGTHNRCGVCDEPVPKAAAKEASREPADYGSDRTSTRPDNSAGLCTGPRGPCADRIFSGICREISP